jgi:hypothetical protein
MAMSSCSRLWQWTQAGGDRQRAARPAPAGRPGPARRPATARSRPAWSTAGGAQPDPGTGGTNPTRPYGARALQRSSPSSRPPSTPARAHPTRPRARASAVPPLTPHLAAMSGSSRRPRRGRPRSRRPGRAAPAHRAVPDEVVEAVAQRHRRRQVGEPVEGSALVLLHLPSRSALALRLPALYGRTVGQESREGGTGRGIFSAMRPAVVHQRGSGRFGCRLRQ